MSNEHIINDIIAAGKWSAELQYNLLDQMDKNERAIVYVQQGKGVLLKDGQSTQLSQGDLFVVFKDEKQTKPFYVIGQQLLQLFFIKFSSASVQRVQGVWNCKEIISQPLLEKEPLKVHSPRIHFIMEELIRLWSANYRNIYEQNFLDYFNRLIQTITIPTNESEVKQHNFLEEIKSYLDDHFAENIQISNLVKSSGLNLTTFYKEFKEYTGVPPLQYITNKRIEKAKHLLISNNSIQISNVALEVGYNDSYYFSRIFKKLVGISPKKFSDLFNKTFFVLTPAFAADLLALGVSPNLLHPLAQTTFENFMRKSYATTYVEERNVIDHNTIIFENTQNKEYKKSQQISPVYCIPYKGMPWRERLCIIAKQLGSTELAETWLSHYDKRLQVVREKLKNKINNEPILAIRALDDNIRIFGTKRRKLSHFLYNELDLTAPTFIQGVTYYDISYSSDELAHLDARHILLLTDSKNKQQISFLKKKIKGQIYEVNSFPWTSYSALGHEKMLTEIIKLLG